MKQLSDLTGLRGRAVRVARAAEMPLDNSKLTTMATVYMLTKAIQADEDGLRANVPSFRWWLGPDWCAKESPRSRFTHCFDQFVADTLEDCLAGVAILQLARVSAGSARQLQEEGYPDESLAAYLGTYPTLSERIYAVLSESGLFQGYRGTGPLLYLFSLCRSLDFDLAEFVDLRLTYQEFTLQTGNDNE